MIKAPRTISISKKLLLLVLATSTIGTTISSLVQIGFEYGAAKDDQFSEVKVFAATAIPSLQNLVWSYNETSLLDQLHSALTPEDFVSIVVTNEKNVVQAEFKKEKEFSHTEKKSFKLQNPTNNNEIIGNVTLEYTNDLIISNLKNKLIIILLSNLIKTFIISSVLIWVFRLHVVNQLSELAQYLKNQDWSHPKPFGKHKSYWPFAQINDEFTIIEEALNKAVLQIEKNIEMLEMASRSSARLAELGTLSAGLAHEINNPLTLISGYAKMTESLLTSEPHPNPKLTRYTTGTLNACRRITDVITGMKHFARDGSADSFELCRVENLVKEIEPLCRGALTQRKVNLEINIDPPDMVLECRQVQISQVLLNLINNAADAIDHLEEKWIQICFFYESEQFVTITITDSGLGIPLKIRNRLFVPFFTTKDVGKGTGLGLSIVHGIIAQHGGAIAVNGSCKNTQFIIKFPRKEVKNAA